MFVSELPSTRACLNFLRIFMMSCCHLIRAVFQSFTTEANTVLDFGYLAGLVLKEMTIHLLNSFSVQSDMRF